jgi:hypothetical protein
MATATPRKKTVAEQEVARIQSLRNAAITAKAASVTQQSDLKAQAVAAGVPDVSDYARLPEAAKRALLGVKAPTLSEYMAGGVEARDRYIAELSAAGLSSAADITDQYTDDDDNPNFIRLYDPPLGGFHRSRSRVHVTQLEVMLRKGFSDTPIAPIWPEPDLPCGYIAPSGVPCEKFVETEQERLAHFKARHKAAWDMQEDERRQARDRQQSEQQTALMEAMRAIADRTAPAPAPTDDPRIAALEAQIAALMQQVQPAPADPSP